MVFSNLNRFVIGILLIIVVYSSFVFQLDLILVLLLLLLITYDFFYLKITNNFFLILLIIISIISFSFIKLKLFDYLPFISIIIFLSILFYNKYKKEFFIISLYIFCITLFYIINYDRNIFYLLIFISFINDTIAFISGKTIGGPLILPKISPKKTWSGTLSSFFVTTVLLIFFNFNIFISMILSSFLFIGDIFFSYMKRFLHIKDFSKLLGEHGGILDRLDSMFFVATILQIYLVLDI